MARASAPATSMRHINHPRYMEIMSTTGVYQFNSQPHRESLLKRDREQCFFQVVFWLLSLVTIGPHQQNNPTNNNGGSDEHETVKSFSWISLCPSSTGRALLQSPRCSGSRHLHGHGPPQSSDVSSHTDRLTMTYPDATHGTAIGLPIRPGVVEKGSMGKYGSPMERLG